jgi:hypothetical protein
MMTVCSAMHCYEQVEMTDDPAQPPFCDKHTKIKEVDESAATSEDRPDPA